MKGRRRAFVLAAVAAVGCGRGRPGVPPRAEASLPEVRGEIETVAARLRVSGRQPYLPSGARRAYVTPETAVVGPRRIEVESPLGTLPVWVRDGVTIPAIHPITETLVAPAVTRR